MALGVVLLVPTGLRKQAPSVWGLRLFYLGLGVLLLVPGLALIVGVLVGRLMLAAAFGALVFLLLGSGILYGLRSSWHDPARGGPTDRGRPS